ncbi:MAG: cell division protein ZapA [Bryobacteraceae bacterium]
MEQDSGERKQVKVTILNQSFTLLTTGNPQDMVDLANKVDELMISIARKSPNLDSTRIAVFACLHLADQLRSTETTFEAKARQFATLLDRALEQAS